MIPPHKQVNIRFSMDPTLEVEREALETITSVMSAFGEVDFDIRLIEETQ